MGTSETSTVNSIPRRRPESGHGEQPSIRFAREQKNKKKSASTYQEEAGRSRSHPKAPVPPSDRARIRAAQGETEPAPIRSRAALIEERAEKKNQGGRRRGEKSSNRKSAMRFMGPGEETVGTWGKRTGTAPPPPPADRGGDGLGSPR